MYWYNSPSWWWALWCSKHVERWNKINTWKSASSWLLTRICNEMRGQQNIKSSRIILGWIQTFVSPNSVTACMMQVIRMVKRLKHVTLWRQSASHPSLPYYNNLTSKQPSPFFSLTARNFSKLPISALRFPSSAICLISICKFYVLRPSKRDQSY